MHCLGFFGGTNRPRVKDQEVAAQISSTFSKAPYQELVVGETISDVVAHFKLVLFHL